MYNDITFNIDLNNLEAGIKEFQKSSAKIQRGYELGVEELADRLRDKVLERLNAYGLGGSVVASSIVIHDMGDGLRVEAGSEYSMYVEYGTGIVGSNNPHPHPWEYDINDHGEGGWIYVGSDGRTHWTKGQPAKPFMYESWLWARRSGTQIIKKNIRKQFK